MSARDSYGAIAETYATLSEPAYFAAPARDLLALLRVTPSMRLLDVGCGAGALSGPAAQSIDAGFVVAADRSVGMLAVCRRRVPTASHLACELPRLPYPGGVFDAATAAFVLSHLAEPTLALVEIARVLRPGGVLGISCWLDTALASPPGRLWQEHLERHASPEDLAAVSAAQLPAETALADPQRLTAALERAGVAIRELVVPTFHVSMSTAAFVASRAVSSTAQHVQSCLGPAEWKRCLAVAADGLTESFGDQLSFDLRACLACATRP